MGYTPTKAPEGYETAWLDEELKRIEQALAASQDVVQFKEWHEEPPKPRSGQVYFADGTDWDPGSGQGMYVYDGAAFVFLGFTSLPANSVNTAAIQDSAVTSAKIADGAVTTAKIGDGQVTNAKLADMAAWTIKMRNSGSSGDPQDQTVNDLTEETDIDEAADFVLLWDASASAMRKAKPENMVPAGGLELLNSGTVTNAATLDIVLTSFTAYRALRFQLTNFLPATDGANLQMQWSTNGGASYDASGYNWSAQEINDNPTSAARGSNSATAIILGLGVGNAATEGISSHVDIFGQTSTAFWNRCTVHSYFIDNNATPRGTTHVGGGSREAAQDTDAVRFSFSSGNIASGSWALYGYL